MSTFVSTASKNTAATTLRASQHVRFQWRRPLDHVVSKELHPSGLALPDAFGELVVLDDLAALELLPGYAQEHVKEGSDLSASWSRQNSNPCTRFFRRFGSGRGAQPLGIA